MVLGPGIMYSATTLVTMVLAVVLMLRLSPSLSLWVLIPVPFVVLVVRYFGTVIHALYETIQASLATLSAKAQENLAGRARDPRLCAGGRGNARLRRAEPRIRRRATCKLIRDLEHVHARASALIG